MTDENTARTDNYGVNETYIIAEAGLNHNGSPDVARKLINVAAVSGADAVKFQKRTVEKLAVKSVLDAKDDRFPGFGDTYRKIREAHEFDLETFVDLKAYAENKGLDFLCTPFDIDAADFLENVGVNQYKLASHSLTNLPLVKYVAQLGRRTFLSTGMAELSEIDSAVEYFKISGTELILLHCVSSYPTPMKECNLSAIQTLHDRYGLPVGYSGHELGMLPTLTATVMGASAIERHITLDKSMEGFDHRISLEPDELVKMVRSIREISMIKGSGDKRVSDNEMVTRHKYHVSAVSAQIIPKGTILSDDMIEFRNPGTGIPPKNIADIVGKVALVDIEDDVLLTVDMVG